MFKVPPLFALLILTGCASTTPPQPAPFPIPPAEAMQRAPRTLETLPVPTTDSKTALTVTVDNFRTYRETRDRLDELQDWVTRQLGVKQ